MTVLPGLVLMEQLVRMRWVGSGVSAHLVGLVPAVNLTLGLAKTNPARMMPTVLIYFKISSVCKYCMGTIDCI
jgi:hypothetical protein